MFLEFSILSEFLQLLYYTANVLGLRSIGQSRENRRQVLIS